MISNTFMEASQADFAASKGSKKQQKKQRDAISQKG